MSATAALIFLMDAATGCGALGATPPRAGAEFVRAILDVEPQPFEPSAPAPAAMSEAGDARPAESEPEPAGPQEGAAAGQCGAVSISVA